MSTIRVVYNEEGWLQFRLVPQGALPVDYRKGIFVGPPDLTELGLGDTSTQSLNNILVEKGFAEYPDLRGKRRQIITILKTYFDSERLKFARNELLRLYQQAYYPDKFDY